MYSGSGFPIIINYRGFDEVHPSVKNSLHTAADVIDEDIEIYLDARNDNEEKKENWHEFFQEILEQDAEIKNDEVQREEKDDYPLIDDPVKPLAYFMDERRDEIAKVETGPVFEPELIEEGVKKLTIKGMAEVEDANAENKIGKFLHSGEEAKEKIDQRAEKGLKYWGKVDEIDEKMTEYLINNADLQNTVILRQSPNHLAYKLEREGLKPLEANMQGIEERNYQGLTQREYNALKLHEETEANKPRYRKSEA